MPEVGKIIGGKNGWSKNVWKSLIYEADDPEKLCRRVKRLNHLQTFELVVNRMGIQHTDTVTEDLLKGISKIGRNGTLNGHHGNGINGQINRSLAGFSMEDRLAGHSVKSSVTDGILDLAGLNKNQT